MSTLIKAIEMVITNTLARLCLERYIPSFDICSEGTVCSVVLLHY
jgi:hypothetical protein